MPAPHFPFLKPYDDLDPGLSNTQQLTDTHRLSQIPAGDDIHQFLIGIEYLRAAISFVHSNEL